MLWCDSSILRMSWSTQTLWPFKWHVLLTAVYLCLLASVKYYTTHNNDNTVVPICDPKIGTSHHKGRLLFITDEKSTWPTVRLGNIVKERFTSLNIFSFGFALTCCHWKLQGSTVYSAVTVNTTAYSANIWRKMLIYTKHCNICGDIKMHSAHLLHVCSLVSGLYLEIENL